jgi:hypothetical protein
VALFTLVLMSGFANANLIVNGGFENNAVNDGKWKWYASSNVDGWEGDNIEIWDSLNGVHAYEGENHAELNAHPGTGHAFTIFQTFATVANESYNLSFAYRARSNNDEAFLVEVMAGTAIVFTELVDDHITSGWKVFNAMFTATDTTAKLSFTSVSPSTATVGNFIDDVSVVSAPGALILFLLGGSLVVARRFSK